MQYILQKPFLGEEIPETKLHADHKYCITHVVLV